MKIIAVTTDKFHTERLIDANYQEPHNLETIEISDKPLKFSDEKDLKDRTENLLEDVIARIKDIRGEGAVILDVNNPAIAAYMSMTLTSKMFESPDDEMIQLLGVHSVDLGIAINDSEIVMFD